MKRKDITWATVGILVVCLIMAFTTGCIEEQQVPQATTPTFGQGDPPASWVETFGNDNNARMDYVQMQMFSAMDARIKVLEDFCRVDNDPNGR